MPGISIDFAKVYIIFIKDEKEDYNLHFLAISTQPINHRKSQKTSIKFIPCLGTKRSLIGNEFTYRIPHPYHPLCTKDFQKIS